jgi:hypothetical protein
MKQKEDHSTIDMFDGSVQSSPPTTPKLKINAELVKQLAEQASKDNECGYPVTLEYTNRFAQKLTEAVVQECINQIKQHFGNK